MVLNDLKEVKSENDNLKVIINTQSDMMESLNLRKEELEFEIALNKLDIRIDERKYRLMHDEEVSFFNAIKTALLLNFKLLVCFPKKLVLNLFLSKRGF